MKTILRTFFVLSLTMACSTEDTLEIQKEEDNQENPQTENPQTENPETGTPNNVEDLQGDWFRVGGNNPYNNGMKVRVESDSAVITDPQLSNFMIGDIKWADILNTEDKMYTHQELGSDYNYYNAGMVLGTDDTLRISVQNTGSGNIQKWVRNYDIIDINECNPYTTLAFIDSTGGTWNEFNEFDTFPALLKTPMSELGGGYFTISVSTDLVPTLSIYTPLDANGTIYTSSSANTDEPLINSFAFMTYPGSEFDVRVNPFIGDASFPLAYAVKWEFFPRMDCFEPNDTFEQAKAISKGDLHEAFGILGYKDKNGVASGDENTYDWYKITNNGNGSIEFTLESCPSDLWINAKVFNQLGAELTGNYTAISGNPLQNQPGSTYHYATNPMPIGIYYIRLEISGKTKVDLNVDNIPEFWNEPYEFSVDVIE